MAHLVAADHAVDRADVGAGAAAHAAQDLGEERVLGHLASAVVEEDDVHLLLAAGSGQALVGAADPGHVGGDGLARGVLGHHAQDLQGVVQGAAELVDAGDGDVHAGQGGDQAGVALVGHQADGAGLGDGEVGAADAHVGFGVLAAQLAAGDLDQALDVRGLVLVGDLGEEFGHLVAGQVDGRHDHVARAFAAQLDDPLAEVRLDDFEVVLLQAVVEEGLLGRHGLGLDDLLAGVVLGDAGHDLVGLVAVLGPVHLDAVGLGLGLELGVELVQAGDAGVLDLGDLVDEGVHVVFTEGVGPADGVGRGELFHGAAQEGVVQSLAQLLVVIGKCFGRLHYLSSRIRMCSSRGPCTPRARTRSMSAVRLAPVTKAR